MSDGPGTRDQTPSPRVAAGFLARLTATLIDMVLFCLLSALLFLPAGSAIEWQEATRDLERLARNVSDPGWIGHAASVVGLWIALWWCYFVVGWGLLGATPGKWLCRLEIEDHMGRCPVGAVRAALRLGAYCVSSMTIGVGHLMILLRPDRRALHDILAGTRVVKRRPRRRS